MSAPAAASAEKEEAPTLPQELVSKLLALDDDYTKIQKRLEREIRELERSYDKELTPIIEARAQLLAEPGEGGSNHVKGFWKKVLRNSTEFEDDVEEWDLPVLEYLVDITTDDLFPSSPAGDEAPCGFSLTFAFAENPYFTNDKLTKKYHYGEGKEFLKQTEIVEIESDGIDWKPGMDVTVEVVRKKKKGSGAKNRAAMKTVTRDRPSFFKFFTSLGPNYPIPEWLELPDDEDSEDDEDELERLHMLMADDWERAEMLKDNIIPHAIRWYTGEACPDDEVSEYTIADDDEEEVDDESAAIAMAEANF
ncbi:nucleosome assembly [Perkinsus olseni]|uniref:Nucleosome assembly n=2 Tax=Perkinsus olseni TaxID=32597 RepID=A0A7J6PJ76_PEROL|nr:nucleosome assembly [Perkinsus olseni]